MKVLHLPTGIGMGYLCRALRRHGIYAKSCSFSSDRYAYFADIQFNLKGYNNKEKIHLRKSFFYQALREYDIFHFHFGFSFLPDNSDLKILKKRGKKLIVHHRGSEVRMLSKAKSFNNPYIRVKPSWTEDKIQTHLERLSKYIDYAIVPDHELLAYVEPYYKKVYVVPHIVNVDEFKPMFPSPSNKPLIVHAPSNKNVKGTEYVMAAVDQLKREGHTFHFQLIENLPHEKAMKLYEKATIVVDQLLIGSYANLSMEAMAMGKPVVCYIREDLRKKFPSDLPIVSANPQTIYNELKNLLENPGSWRHLGIKGRQYVKRHHSYDVIAKQLISIYKRI